MTPRAAALLLVAVFLLPLAANAQGRAYLVKDINAGSDPGFSSDPREFVTVGATTFFNAEVTGKGRKLWKSDGTAAGTVPVKDVGPPSDGLNPDQLTAAGDLLFFRAFGDAAGANALFRSDGTAAGTTVLKPSVDHLVAVGATLFFATADDAHGTELWRSDGTAAGTALVQDIRPGREGSSPFVLVDVGGTLFFFAKDGINDTALWTSDGTAEGTTRVTAIAPSSASVITPRAAFRPVAAALGALFFAANDGVHGIELWKSDGTEAGTALVKDINPGNFPNNGAPDELVQVDGALFFRANDGVHGVELWRSDGTADATVLVKDINPGPSDSIPAFLTEVHGTLFFAADDGAHGVELWRSDGTEAGTVLLQDILPGATPAHPGDLTNVSGTLFFRALDRFPAPLGTASPGIGELWKSDGTEAGTLPVKDIGRGPFRSDPSQLANANGILIFSANDGRVGREVWRSDGTEEGTMLLKDINFRPGSSDPIGLGAVNDTLFLIADDGDHGRELWKSDGTASGTVLVKDIYPGLDGPFFIPLAPNTAAPVGDALCFVADDGSHGAEIWKSDGTEIGTRLVKDIRPDPISVEPPRFLINAEGTLFFAASDGLTGYELWKSDGTEAGTLLVKDLRPGPEGTVFAGFASIGTTLFFVTRGLWKSDGTDAGTVLVKDTDIAPGTLSSTRTKLFFRGLHDLWASDGTSEGTVRVTGDTTPSGFTMLDDSVFFSGLSPGSGTELWRSDGTAQGTVMVRDINPGSASSMRGLSPIGLAVNGVLLFAANDGQHGVELWKSDGTEAGTALVIDLLPGTASSLPLPLASVNGLAFFLVSDFAARSTSVWMSDGTAEGTVRVRDTGLPFGGASLSFAATDSTFFFSPESPSVGRELWAVSPGYVPPTCVGDCGGDALVTINEIITGVNIALGSAPLSQCPVFDADGNGEVTVNELIVAVNNALNGCA